ncbi:MAG: hypothetical protein Q9225_003369 [Loekoesia sp. 1 TL-2023]
MHTGIVPGNRNADNIDEALRKYGDIVYPTAPIHNRQIKAFLVTSFGFGQKGGQVVGAAPRHLFATLQKAAYEDYASRVRMRMKAINRAYTKAMLSNSIFKARALPPYHARDESKILMDPFARVSEDAFNNLHFDSSNLHPGMQVGHQLLDPRSPSPAKAMKPDLCSTPFPKDRNLFEAASKDWVE